MNTLPTFIPVRPRVRRKRRSSARFAPPPPPPPPPPAALVLVSATYDVGIPCVRLTFDRAIDIGAFVGTGVVVDDAADSGNAYQGTGGAFHVGANALEIFLVDPTPATGTGTTLSVAAGNGIVAAPLMAGRGAACLTSHCRIREGKSAADAPMTK